MVQPIRPMTEVLTGSSWPPSHNYRSCRWIGTPTDRYGWIPAVRFRAWLRLRTFATAACRPRPRTALWNVQRQQEDVRSPIHRDSECDQTD
jgi:hypothetical protein